MDTTKTAMSSSEMVETTQKTSIHPLYDKWVLWAHLPHDTDWSIRSYKKISEITNVEQMLSLYSILP